MKNNNIKINYLNEFIKNNIILFNNIICNKKK